MHKQPTQLKTVFLYSGGMDSYIGAYLTDADVLLHVDTGTGYGDVEKEKLTTPPGMEDRLRRVNLRDLAQWERPDDLILPNRNAHLVLAAANYGNIIYLGATAGDRTNDKNEAFVERINKLLSHLYAPQWWLPEGKEARVELPLKPYTKRQLVEKYLGRGGDATALSEDTFSCYHPTSQGLECGACKPCVRKWVALMANGVVPSFEAYDAVVEARDALLADGGSRGPQELTDFNDAIDEYEGLARGGVMGRARGMLRRLWCSWCENSEKHFAVKYGYQELDRNHTGLIPSHYFVRNSNEDKGSDYGQA